MLLLLLLKHTGTVHRGECTHMQLSTWVYVYTAVYHAVHIRALLLSRTHAASLCTQQCLPACLPARLQCTRFLGRRLMGADVTTSPLPSLTLPAPTMATSSRAERPPAAGARAPLRHGGAGDGGGGGETAAAEAEGGERLVGAADVISVGGLGIPRPLFHAMGYGDARERHEEVHDAAASAADGQTLPLQAHGEAGPGLGADGTRGLRAHHQAPTTAVTAHAAAALQLSVPASAEGASSALGSGSSLQISEEVAASRVDQSMDRSVVPAWRARTLLQSNASVNASGSGSGSCYLWEYVTASPIPPTAPLINASTTLNITATGLYPGTRYTFRLTVADGSGGFTSDNVTLVTPGPGDASPPPSPSPLLPPLPPSPSPPAPGVSVPAYGNCVCSAFHVPACLADASLLPECIHMVAPACGLLLETPPGWLSLQDTSQNMHEWPGAYNVSTSPAVASPPSSLPSAALSCSRPALFLAWPQAAMAS